MTRPVIGVDVDSTVWDAVGAFSKSGKLLSPDKHHEPHEHDSWDYMKYFYGKELSGRIFEHALHPDRVSDRKLYPGCREAIKTLKKAGYKIVFISHSFRPDQIVVPVTEWLRFQFGSDVGVCVLHHTESKLEVLRAMRGIAMIDDKPSTAIEVADAEILSIMPQHPYNVYAEANSGIVPFDPETQWNEVPDTIEQYVENLINQKSA